MKTISFLIISLCLLSHLQAQDNAYLSNAQNSQILVQFKAQKNKQNLLQNFRKTFHASIKIKRNVVPSRNIYLLQYAESLDPSKVITWLRRQKQIAFAQTNPKVNYRNKTPDDSFYSDQWNMDIIKAPQAWDKSTGGLTANGDEIVVAIIDSGTQIEHDDLKDNIWVNSAEIPNDGIDNDNNGYIDDYQGWNTDSLSDQHPSSFHGTAVTGIIGARGNNNQGVTGVNWKVKLLNISGANFADEIVEMYYYVADLRRAYNSSNGTKGAFVVATNSSFGLSANPADFPLWCNAYDTLGLVGVLSAGATSNADTNVDQNGDMPSGCSSDFLIVVTDTNMDDERHFSGYGKKNVDIGAPGSPTYTTNQNNAYANFGGTSSATPHIAGAIALLYSMPCEELATNALLSPATTALKVKNHILKGVDKLSSLKTKTSSGGRLNIERSAELLLNNCSGVGPLRFITLAPNPTRGMLNLSFQRPDNTIYNINVYNAIGQLVYETTIEANSNQSELSIQTAGWAKGVYFISLENVNDIISAKFIVY